MSEQTCGNCWLAPWWWCGEWKTMCSSGQSGPVESMITLPPPTYTNPTCPLHGREETNDDKQDATARD